jgi:pimeloyl-ACP methyl ester carboxylesterase
MKVYFSHGKESGPWGSKIKRLASVATEIGFIVESLDYSFTQDPDTRLAHLLKALKQEQDEVVLVGSSMGGYVSLVASETANTHGVFLLAPALYMPDYECQQYSPNSPVTIVHGWSDEVIPPEHSIRFAREANRSLYLIPGDHRLNTSLNEVESLFRLFLLSIQSIRSAQVGKQF